MRTSEAYLTLFCSHHHALYWVGLLLVLEVRKMEGKLSLVKILQSE